MSIARTAVFGLSLLVACSDGSSGVRFVGLEEGAVVGGLEATEVDADVAAGVDRVELFLDDDRVGAAPFAPFVVEWTTVGFDEGKAELRARAHISDGSTRDEVIGVVIDNTPPEIFDLPDEVNEGDLVEVHVFDEHRVVLVELDGPPGISRTWDAPPFTLQWDVNTDYTEFEITAVDEVGWSSTRGDGILVRRSDADGDGYAAGSSSDADCDDSDPAVYPGAPDDGRVADLNCDGVLGTDNDGDGFALVGWGGRDCDDGDPAIHPEGFVYGQHPLEIDGVPLEWEPGTASLAFTLIDGWRTLLVAINRGGTLELATIQPDKGVTSRSEMAQGVNLAPAFLQTAEADYLFYGQGTDLRALVLRDGDWSDELVLVASELVEQVTIDQYAISSAPAVAIRAGATIHVARLEGGTWQSRLAVEGPGLADAPMSLVTDPGSAVVNYVIGTTLTQAVVPWNPEQEIYSYSIGRVEDPASMLAACDMGGNPIHGEAGCLVYSGDPPQPVASCSPPVERLICMSSGNAYFQLGSGVMGHYTNFGPIDYIRMAGDVASDGPYAQPVFARPGSYSWVEDAVAAPDDPIDEVDRDCDGLDD